MCKTKYAENRRTTQEVTADETVLYLFACCGAAHGAEPGSWCTQGTWSLPPTVVAAEVGGRGSVKVTRMMFELEPPCESEMDLEDSGDVSVCSCHSFSLSFSPLAKPLWGHVATQRHGSTPRPSSHRAGRMELGNTPRRSAR